VFEFKILFKAHNFNHLQILNLIKMKKQIFILIIALAAGSTLAFGQL